MLVTEWQEFRMPDWCAVRKAMRMPVVFDGRNIYNGEEALLPRDLHTVPSDADDGRRPSCIGAAGGM